MQNLLFFCQESQVLKFSAKLYQVYTVSFLGGPPENIIFWGYVVKGQGHSKLKWPWKTLACCLTPKVSSQTSNLYMFSFDRSQVSNTFLGWKIKVTAITLVSCPTPNFFFTKFCEILTDSFNCRSQVTILGQRSRSLLAQMTVKNTCLSHTPKVYDQTSSIPSIKAHQISQHWKLQAHSSRTTCVCLKKGTGRAS